MQQSVTLALPFLADPSAGLTSPPSALSCLSALLLGFQHRSGLGRLT